MENDSQPAPPATHAGSPPGAGPRPALVVAVLFLSIGAVAVIYRLAQPDELIDWRTGLDSALAASRQTGKPALAYFTAAWCAPCQTLKRTTFADAEVNQAMQAYIPVKIDIDAEPALARRYNIEAVPAFLQLDGDGRVQRQTAGALAPGPMVLWLKR